MRTFKKKDIKKINVDELVDADGGIIDGDKSYETTSQIQTAPQQDTDSFVVTAKQKFRYPYGYSYGGTPYSHGDRGGHGISNGIGIEEANLKMAKMVEDILTQRLSQNSIVNKQGIDDINRNQIPDLEELTTKYNKQDIASNMKKLVTSVSSENLSAEEKAIVLNYIIKNIGTKDIGNDYKRILKSII